MFNLSFLNSGILSLAFAALIPLIIYLFAKKKPHRIIFSSIRFIKESQQKQKTKINLKNLILLLIRMLIILFTILAISRPTMKLPFLKNSTKHPKTAIAIIIDNSYSMDYLVDTQTELEKAKRIAGKINSILSNDDITVIFSLSQSWNKVNSQLVYGKMGEKKIHSIKLIASQTPLSDIILEAQEKLKQSHIPNQEIYVISDMQEQILPEKLDTNVFFIPTSGPEMRINISCQNVYLINDFVNKSFNKNLTFSVVNHSNYKQDDIICRLFMNGRTIAEKASSLNPFQRKKERFQLELEKSGWHSGYVEVKNERLAYDNRYYFSFYYNHDPQIAIISDNSSLPMPLESMLEIYSQNSKNIHFVNLDNTNIEELIKYDNVVLFQKNNFSGKLKFLLENAAIEGKKILYIADKNLTENAQEFISGHFDLKFENYISSPQKMNLDYANSYHPITKLLNIEPILIADFWKVKTGSTILLQAEDIPVAITRNNSVLWLFDCNSLQNPFLLNHSFPVFTYRTLQFLTDDFTMAKNSLVNQKISLKSSLIILPDGTNLNNKNNSYTPSQTGLYKLDENGSTVAVNLDYKESDYKRFSDIKMKNTHFLDENWEQDILQSRYGYEIWKLLLFLVLILFLLEMMIVKLSERK